MENRHLEVSYRKGKPVAAYLYLPRVASERSARTERAGESLLVDYAADGRPIGVEITAPGIVSINAVNDLLERLGVEPLRPEEIAELQAARAVLDDMVAAALEQENEAWEQEIARREAEIDAGTAELIPAEDVFEETERIAPGMRIEPPTTCPTADACLAVDLAVWSAHVDAVRAEARRDMESAMREGTHERARHWRLFAEVLELDPRDWAPLGLMERERPEGFGPDCAAGCAWFLKLRGDLGYDWGVCGNPSSHRVGRLTFEHQGCPEFEVRDDESWTD